MQSVSLWSSVFFVVEEKRSLNMIVSDDNAVNTVVTSDNKEVVFLVICCS